jgi:hypothetical protein
MARAVSIRTLAVVACAQNVVLKASASAAPRPAQAEFVQARTARLTQTSVSAAKMADRELVETVGETKGGHPERSAAGAQSKGREINQLRTVYSA